MRAFLNSMDVWPIVMLGWTCSYKAIAKWTTAEKNACIGNDKGMNAIFMAVSPEEFQRISQCEIANEARDILEVTHGGTKTIKTSKLQMLTSKF